MRWLPTLALAAVVSLASACVDKPTEHRVRANAYLRGGDADKALVEVEAGLGHSPNDVSLLILKGKALFELERYADAKIAFDSAISEGESLGDKALTEAYLGLAMVAMRQQDFAAARASFQKLVDVDGKNHHARINLARICLQLEDIACALTHGEEAGHVQGDSEEVLFTLGRIYCVAKKYDEAEKTFEHICEVVPGAASCPYGVALVAAQRGDKPRAVAKLREALEKKLPNPDKLAEDPLLASLKGDPAFEELAASAARPGG